MTLKLFDSLNRKKEVFKPQKGKNVKMYVCGPTVYGPDHLGHARVGVFYDVLRRYLEYQGFKVEMTQNITDVGHLTDDADEGEDKIEKKAKEESKSPQEIAKHFAQAHFNDMQKLNVRPPDNSPRASEHIPQIIEFVQELIEKGYAYQVKGNVYFSVDKFEDYGKLSGRNVEEMSQGVRVEKDELKKNPADFALWLKADPSHLQKWGSPWGQGYPGWHIECSTMNNKIAGATIDIHGGGIDLIFPHHENEIAQTEALTGKQFVKYWVHVGMVTVNGEKMSKSKGNQTTIKDILKKANPDQIRVAVLMTRYRKPFDYNLNRMKEAGQVISKLAQAKAKSESGDSPKERKEIEAILDNDLNTPRVISYWLEHKDTIKQDLFADLEAIIGISLNVDKIPVEIKKKAEKREKLRQADKYEEADKVREQVEDSGYQIEDVEDGYQIRKI